MLNLQIFYAFSDSHPLSNGRNLFYGFAFAHWIFINKKCCRHNLEKLFLHIVDFFPFCSSFRLFICFCIFFIIFVCCLFCFTAPYLSVISLLYLYKFCPCFMIFVLDREDVWPDVGRCSLPDPQQGNFILYFIF